MPQCTGATIELGRLSRRVIEANFEGGDIGSDGGGCCCAKSTGASA